MAEHDAVTVRKINLGLNALIDSTQRQLSVAKSNYAIRWKVSTDVEILVKNAVFGYHSVQ